MISCRNCKSKKIKKVIFIGKQVVSSIFPSKSVKNSKKYSLDLYECEKCKLVQLGKSIPLGNMYGETYGYRSSLSKLMINHLYKKYQKIKKIEFCFYQHLLLDTYFLMKHLKHKLLKMQKLPLQMYI